MKLLFAGAVALAIAGCVSTQEMPLAPNIVRLDTRASGEFFTDKAGAITMHRAAELTLKAGYSHFRLDQAQMGQGSQFGGMQTSVFGAGTPYVTAISTPVNVPTSEVGVTVTMFHADEPGAKGAFDAQYVFDHPSQ